MSDSPTAGTAKVLGAETAKVLGAETAKVLGVGTVKVLDEGTARASGSTAFTVMTKLDNAPAPPEVEDAATEGEEKPSSLGPALASLSSKPTRMY